MKQKIIIPVLGLSLLLIIINIGCTQIENGNGSQPPEEQTIEEKAIALMNHFNNGTFQQAYDLYLNDEIKSLTTPLDLQIIWNGIINQYGDLIRIQSTRITQEQEYDIVFVTCEYDKLGLLDTRVVFDANHSISGLQFVPTDVSDQYQPPQYADTNQFTEQNVTVGEGTSWPLPGTLTVPTGEGPFPVVILVHGSGPNDRDETIGPNKPFKDLAWGLACQGIAVLRYEKRTKQYSQQIITDIENITVQEETIDDALAAIQLLQNTTLINPNQIFILGHSLGGMLAPRIGQQDNNISGLLLLAAPTRHLEDLMLEQTIYLAELDGNITTAEQTGINLTQEAWEKIKSLNITPGEVILGASLNYWEDLSTYDQVATAKNLTIPLLILQGERDYQVSLTEDYTTWYQTFSDNPNITLQTYESLNHLFISGSGTPSNQEYNVPGNVAEQVIIDITDWIEQHI